MIFSIIVTVYNAEKYLNRCLDSIFNQKFSGSFEVIAVNDASSDKSLEILKDFKKYESRLTIISHKTNKKVSIARTTGMHAAIGDYILHVDSDDWILPGALELLYIKCKETKADVIVYDYCEDDGLGSRNYKKKIKNELLTNDKIIVQHLFVGAVWNKIVKREFTKNMLCSELSLNNTEDFLYSIEILLRANKIYLIPHCLYAYFKNNNSLTTNVKLKDYLINLIPIFQQYKKIIDQYNASLVFRRKVNNIMDKNIFFMLARLKISSDDSFEKKDEFINSYNIFTGQNTHKKKQLINAFKNKYYCLFLLVKHSGFNITIRILIAKLFK